MLYNNNASALATLAQQLHARGEKARAAELCAQALASSPLDGESRRIVAEILSADVPQWHFNIVRDMARNEAYEAALRRVVFPGCKVLEIGTGTGLLAMMAARAGAGEVITCESASAIAAAAQEIIERNGYAGRVRVLNKHSNQLDVQADLGGPADILVSEIISDNLLSEGVLPTHEYAIRHLIKPGAKILPARGRVRIALADDDDWERARMDWIAGFDLSPFNRLIHPYQDCDVGSGRLVLRSEAADLFNFDFTSGGPYPEATAHITLTAQGSRINGVAQWIALDMDGLNSYENRPEPGTHSSWQAVFHRFEEPLQIVPGEAVSICARHNRSALRIWAA